MPTMTRLEWRRIAYRARVLIFEGKKIEAIKYLREQTDARVSDAYHAVNQLADIPLSKWTPEERS